MLRHRGEEYLNVQKYRPPDVGAAEASSPSAMAIELTKNVQIAHWERIKLVPKGGRDGTYTPNERNRTTIR